MSGSPSFARDCLTRRTDDLLARSHSSSIYPSAVSLFVLLSLSFVFPSLLPFYPFSVSLFLPIREQVLRSSPYRVPCPSPFPSRTMFHHSTRNLFSRTLKLFGFFNLLIILLRFLSNRPRPLPYSRHHHLLSALSSNSALLGMGLDSRRSILWTQSPAHFNPSIPIASFFPLSFNLIRLRLFPLNVSPIRSKSVTVNNILQIPSNDCF